MNILFVVVFVALLTLLLPWILPVLTGDIKCKLRGNPLKNYAHWVWDFMEKKGWIEL